MFTKKLFYLLSVFVVLAMLVSACGPAATQAPAAEEPTEAPAAEEPTEAPAAEEPAAEEPAKAEPITITFWSGLGSPDNVPMAELVKMYNEQNTDGITVELVEFDWGTLYSKIVLDFKTGNAPDVLTMHQTNLLENMTLGILQPVDEFASAVGLSGDDFVESAWKGTEIDGKRYAIPLDMHPLGLYYNKKAFAEAGLDPAKPPTNKEELLDYATKLTVDKDGDGNIDQYGIAMGYSGGIPFRTWMSLLWQHKGEDVLTPDHKKAAFNTPAGIESLQFIVDLVYKYKVSPQGEQDPDDDFMKGVVAMVITGPWAMGDYNKIEGLEYGTAMIPVIYDQPAAWGNSHTFAFPDNKNPDRTMAAMKFVKWMSDQNLYWTKNSGHQPVRKSVLESEEFKSLELWKAFADTVPYGHYYPAIVKQAQVFGREPTSPFVIMMESVMLNNVPVEEAIALAEQTINEILAEE